ncbi:MAG: hypothetical protein EA428_13655 [Spirochaetaceae bacterium]|nr:MAG: hypothetical protein EA428_13655 [Spirochaetaceae bacterium]
MKRVLFSLLALALFTPTLHAEDFAEARSSNYRVHSQLGLEHAEATAARLEAYLRYFNSYFHLDVEELANPMGVRIYADREGYQNFLEPITQDVRGEFVYLHYNNPLRSILVGHYSDTESYERTLAHQSFVQYLRSFIPNPPPWLREGFAVYFERLSYDADNDHAIYTENLDWLDELRSILDEGQDPQPIPLGAILAMDTEAARANIEVFYPQAWGMVAYFLGTSDRAVNRLMWDTISALEPDADLEDNIRRVRQQAFRWYDTELLVEGFISHVDSMRSYRDLVEDGMRAYSSGDLGRAERYFVEASNIDDTAYLPYYYLGLINFDNASFELSEYYYNAALAAGADEALVSYALGVNAFADSRYATAREKLERAIELGGDTYRAQASDLMGRIRE